MTPKQPPNFFPGVLEVARGSMGVVVALEPQSQCQVLDSAVPSLRLQVPSHRLCSPKFQVPNVAPQTDCWCKFTLLGARSFAATTDLDSVSHLRLHSGTSRWSGVPTGTSVSLNHSARFKTLQCQVLDPQCQVLDSAVPSLRPQVPSLRLCSAKVQVLRVSTQTDC